MPETRPSRYPSRGITEKDAIYQMIDEGLFCTIAFLRDGIPHQIPVGFVRDGDFIYVHASIKSKFIESIIGQKVSFSVTHLDGLVLSPTAVDHSFNYRSVIGFSKVEELTDPNEKLDFFKLFIDRYIPGRIEDVGEPTEDQVSITKVARLSLDNVAGKMREGDVNVKKPEIAPWFGIIPLKKSYGDPEIDSQLSDSVPIPDYIEQLVQKSRK